MKPIEGEVRLNGKRIEEPGLDRGIVFQEPALFPWLTALRNVAFGLEMSGMDKHAVNERAAQVSAIVGLEQAMHLYPYQLSGGMKHRVAVARAWALKDASVLLMDEPFSAIDAINRMTLQKYLVDAWLAEPRTVIYVTHDIDEAIYLADRIAIMTPSPGRIGQYVTVDMARPRDRNSARANELRSELTEIMRRSAVTRRRATQDRATIRAIREKTMPESIAEPSAVSFGAVAAPAHCRSGRAGYGAVRRAPSQPDDRHPRNRQAAPAPTSGTISRLSKPASSPARPSRASSSSGAATSTSIWAARRRCRGSIPD